MSWSQFLKMHWEVLAAMDFFTEWQSIYVDYSGKLQRAQIDVLEEETT